MERIKDHIINSGHHNRQQSDAFYKYKAMLWFNPIMPSVLFEFVRILINFHILFPITWKLQEITIYKCDYLLPRNFSTRWIKFALKKLFIDVHIIFIIQDGIKDPNK